MKLNNMHLIIFLIVVLLFSLFYQPQTIEGLTNDVSGNPSTFTSTTPSTTTNTVSTSNSFLTDVENTGENAFSDVSSFGQDAMGEVSSFGQSTSNKISNLFDPNSSSVAGQMGSSAPGSNIFSSGNQDLSPISSTDTSTLYSSDYSSSYRPGSSRTPSSLIIGPQGQHILATTQNTINGIPPSQIPAGQENLYILKSEVVPPVCPACPNVIIDKNIVQKECQPCPPCARCPEPSFDCKKVPNYSMGIANTYLPRPVLNDFSQFGS